MLTYQVSVLTVGAPAASGLQNEELFYNPGEGRCAGVIGGLAMHWWARITKTL